VQQRRLIPNPLRSTQRASYRWSFTPAQAGPPGRFSEGFLLRRLHTTTSGGKLIFHIFGALAEFERDIIRERTNAGLAAARARGLVGGRRHLLTPKEIALVKKLYEDNTPIADICKTFKISRMTLWRYVKGK